MKTLLVLGRQPKLGLAEIESLYGSSLINRVGSSWALLDDAPENINFDHLGGAIKMCRVLAANETSATDKERFLRENITKELLNYDNGKVNFGISSYSNNLGFLNLNNLGLSIKKQLKNERGQSSRFIASQSGSNFLNSAQVIHNSLDGKKGYEFVVVDDNNLSVLAVTVGIQDIESYGLRDYGRPKRDARVGMLPPKLAQIIINLSTGNVVENNKLTILDPFCGTGVILQEALLMGYCVYGSDISETMVSYTKENIQWLIDQYHLSIVNLRVELGDATNYRWETPYTVIASEVYLGRAYSVHPPVDQLMQTIKDTNTIIEKFLINLSSQLPQGFRLCLAIPAWIGANDKLYRLPLLDHLNKLGYNRLSFERVKDEELIYHRPAQFVGRELLVIVKR